MADPELLALAERLQGLCLGRELTRIVPPSKLLAGVELGGTKCVCILGTGPDDVRAVERLPTGEREETLRQIEAVLDRWRGQYGPPRALGIASFGPVDLRAGSAFRWALILT